MVTVVNIVGSGTLNVELDLVAIENAIEANTTRYDPDTYPGLYLNFTTDSPTITLYRTGSYHISGATTSDELHITHTRLLDTIENLGIKIDRDACEDAFSIRNIVCTAEYPEHLNLNALAIGLGLEHTEYEPEQFPGLVYRLDNPPAVILLFSSGKLVITGTTSLDIANTAYQTLSEQLDALEVRP
jgi:transcription initiation factor TFIID TATA-box-binding protein